MSKETFLSFFFKNEVSILWSVNFWIYGLLGKLYKFYYLHNLWLSCLDWGWKLEKPGANMFCVYSGKWTDSFKYIYGRSNDNMDFFFHWRVVCRAAGGMSFTKRVRAPTLIQAWFEYDNSISCRETSRDQFILCQPLLLVLPTFNLHSSSKSFKWKKVVNDLWKANNHV